MLFVNTYNVVILVKPRTGSSVPVNAQRRNNTKTWSASTHHKTARKKGTVKTHHASERVFAPLHTCCHRHKEHSSISPCVYVNIPVRAFVETEREVRPVKLLTGSSVPVMAHNITPES